MDFSNPKIEELCQQYDSALEKRESLEEDLSRVNVEVCELEEQEITGTGDPETLAAAQKNQTELRRKVEAADRVLERLQQELSIAFGEELALQAANLPSLRLKMGDLRLAAARELGKALAVLQFLQNPEGVFGPDEVVAVVLGPLRGRKSEPGYYPEVIAAVETSAVAEKARIGEEFPDLVDFRELTRKLRFLESWPFPPAEMAKTPAAWAAGERIAAIRNREQFLQVLVSKAIGGQRKKRAAKSTGGGPGPIK